MTNLNASAHDAASSSTPEHRFPWKWYLADLAKVQKNGKTVFSCFSCGGGSSMGYKLAGYDVIGNVEIDPRMMAVYRKNNHPKHSYLMDVRDFLKIPNADLPEELFHLDILDGSPPCSVFSTAGERAKGWGKEKVFREGQAKQRLDDLFFYFIRIAEKLRPRVVIAENVSGLVKGNARGYVREIFDAFDDAGYVAQLFLLNGAFMGVPQRRERTFFVARMKDMELRRLKLAFSEAPIPFGKVRSAYGVDVSDTLYGKLMKYRISTDQDISDISKRVRGRESGFTNKIQHDAEIAKTITSSGCFFRDCDGQGMSDEDFCGVQTFPLDYDFDNQSTQYICGMSVPPVMMAQIATEVYSQWLR